MNDGIKYRDIQGIKRFSQRRPKATEKPWLNSEGYRDPTAYAAMKNIERAERLKGRS